MKWTTKLPTCSGYYWIKSPHSRRGVFGQRDRHIVKIIIDEFGKTIEWGDGGSTELGSSHLGFEWIGPLKEPKD